MALSRRAFVRTVGWGGVGILSSEFILGRGTEELFALGQFSRAELAADPEAIVISSNENPRGPSPAALDVLRGRVNLRVGRYPENVEELEDTVAKMLGGTAENVLLATGSGSLLAAAVHGYVTPSRYLVNGTPSYSSPDRTATGKGARIKHVPVDSGLKLDLDGMADAARGAGLVFLCNPNNPTSTAHSLSAVTDFVKRVRASSPETAILIDEAYIDYAEDPSVRTAAALALEHPNVFMTRTFSKAYGMAGLRLGYAFGQPETLAKIRQAWGLGSVNVLTASAGIAALKDTAHMEAERRENKRVRDFTLAAFRDMRYQAPQSQTNFVFVNIGRPAKEFREACAKHKVFVARDFPPMEKTHARVTIGTMDEMKRATEVFRSVLGATTTTASRG